MRSLSKNQWLCFTFLIRVMEKLICVIMWIFLHMHVLKIQRCFGSLSFSWNSVAKLNFTTLSVVLIWYRFEQYVDYALDVPMYFAYRNKKYVDCTGMTFRVKIYPLSFLLDSITLSMQGNDKLKTIRSSWAVSNLIDFFMLQQFLAGKLPCLPGELPSYNDWENHLTTIFPEVNHLPPKVY